MNWRQWIHQTLIASAPVTAIVPAASIFGSGPAEARIDAKPFIIIRMMPSTIAVKEGIAYKTGAQIWAHDAPGSYVRIDSVLSAVTGALSGVVALPGAVRCTAQGRSQDLADDGFDTITKYASFELVGTGIS